MLKKTNKLSTTIIANFIFFSIFFIFFYYLYGYFNKIYHHSLGNFSNNATSFQQNYVSNLPILIKSNNSIESIITQHCSYVPLPDTRIIALRRFLQNHNSPLKDYTDVIVQAADKYNQDWRIIVAISGVESNFGKITKPNSYNAWGWRGGPNGDFSKFANWEQAIEYITKVFTQGYGQNPDPYSIYKTYCPPCSTAWPDAVTKYMKQLSGIRQEINREYMK